MNTEVNQINKVVGDKERVKNWVADVRKRLMEIPLSRSERIPKFHEILDYIFSTDEWTRHSKFRPVLLGRVLDFSNSAPEFESYLDKFDDFYNTPKHFRMATLADRLDYLVHATLSDLAEMSREMLGCYIVKSVWRNAPYREMYERFENMYAKLPPVDPVPIQEAIASLVRQNPSVEPEPVEPEPVEPDSDSEEFHKSPDEIREFLHQLEANPRSDLVRIRERNRERYENMRAKPSKEVEAKPPKEVEAKQVLSGEVLDFLMERGCIAKEEVVDGKFTVTDENIERLTEALTEYNDLMETEDEDVETENESNDNGLSLLWRLYIVGLLIEVFFLAGFITGSIRMTFEEGSEISNKSLFALLTIPPTLLAVILDW